VLSRICACFEIKVCLGIGTAVSLRKASVIRPTAGRVPDIL